MKKITKFIFRYWQFVLTILVGISALIVAIISGDFENLGVKISIIPWAIFIAIFLFADMIKTLRSGSYGVDILAITAIFACIAVNQPWAALIIVLMLTGGEMLEDYAENRAKRELSDLISRAPTFANKISGNSVQKISISRVKIGDKLLIKTGEIVPVDGKLASKSAEIDESSLTGESFPVAKKSGENIMSGSVNKNAPIEIIATATAKNSQYEKIVRLVKESSENPAPFVRLTDRYAVPFTILSYLIAGFAWWISGDATRFAEVLVVASPCPLILAAPIALISGMSLSSKHGIIVKSGAVLEKIARAKIFAFDKTGTLTEGNVKVDKIVAENNFREKDILSFAASAEIGSSHVLAEALVDFVKKKKIARFPAKNLREITGDGIFANVKNQKIIVGKKDFLVKNKIPGVEKFAKENSRASAIFVAIDNKFAGAIYFADCVRNDAKKTLLELKKSGVKKIAMLTGDHKKTAKNIGEKIGVDEIFAELLPGEKVKTVRKLAKNSQIFAENKKSSGKKQRKKIGFFAKILHQKKREEAIVFVGDGINDAPVLVAASVGIAMGARGSTAASESADAVIMLDKISRVSLLQRISKHTISVAEQSVLSGIALCLVLEIIAAFGFIPALIGAGLQELIDVTVILNALRAHRLK